METLKLTREQFSNAIDNGIYEIIKILGMDKYKVTHYKLCLRTEELIIKIL